MIVDTRSSPLVSIVVTTFNGEKFLEAQLDSLVKQSYTNLEILICDDASSDKTGPIIREYAARDKRITCVFHEKNIGLNANLESGLRIAKGDYIAISDQDDIWKHEKIECLLHSIGNKLAIFSDSALIDEKGLSLNKTIIQTLKVRNMGRSYTLLSLLRQNVVSGHALLFSRLLLDVALPFQKNIIFDHHLALVSATYGGLAYYPQPLVLHRIHTTNSINGRLINKSEAPKIRAIDVIEEKRIRVNKVLDKFSFVLEVLLEIQKRQKPSLLTYNLQVNHDLLADLQPIVFELKKFDVVFFNFSLLVKLIRLRKKYPDYEIFKLRRCISLSKGARWYSFFAKFTKRAAGGTG